MRASEQKVRKVMVEMGATFRRDDLEKVMTINLGGISQRFWMGYWSAAGEWLLKQKPIKRRRKRA